MADCIRDRACCPASRPLQAPYWRMTQALIRPATLVPVSSFCRQQRLAVWKAVSLRESKPASAAHESRHDWKPQRQEIRLRDRLLTGSCGFGGFPSQWIEHRRWERGLCPDRVARDLSRANPPRPVRRRRAPPASRTAKAVPWSVSAVLSAAVRGRCSAELGDCHHHSVGPGGTEGRLKCQKRAVEFGQAVLKSRDLVDVRVEAVGLDGCNPRSLRCSKEVARGPCQLLKLGQSGRHRL